MRNGRERHSFVLGAVVAALLGLLAGRAIPRMEAAPAEPRGEPTPLRRTVNAIARAQMLVMP